ncbi:conserved hypothetical protein [Candidatus Sulfopaludibacter sp. SbA4]|nr:conserved hypothetical protein [Candidatus Sulfopaludibacter sp. SbA4]
MNPGLVIKLRPNGPWRIGPDSGARNRVDAIYHSDSLYSAVTSAMARLGWLEEWLDATARNNTSAVCFSSCFPFLDEIGFVVPPRTVWPPTTPGLMSARVRWKSARFVPLGIVQAILAGQRLDENHWSVDGASECLVPVGRPGPFRSGLRYSAAVDRLTGASERHSTACLEFRPGAGLWTIASFLDEAASTRWMNPVKAAFRLLADTGFGGERSRGWGRSEAPEFIDGVLPDMIVPPKTGAGGQGSGAGEEPVPEAAPVPEPVEAEAAVLAPPVIEPLEADLSELPPDPEPEPPVAESAPPIADPDPPGHEPVPPTPEPEAPATEPSVTPAPEPTPTVAPEAPKTAPPELPASPEPPAAAAPEVAATPAPEPPTTSEPGPATFAAPEPTPTTAPELPATPALEPITTAAPEQPTVVAPEPTPTAAPELPTAPAPELQPTPASEPTTTAAPEPIPTAVPEPPTPAPEPQAVTSPEPPTAVAPEPGVVTAPVPEPPPAEPEPTSTPTPSPQPPTPAFRAPEKIPSFWLLSLYTPAPSDSVDWARGNYTVLARGGRVDSPSGSGELKKQIQMVTEGSVVHAASEPRGCAADVAPDGFPHPVFRAGFAVSIPLPEVS